MTTLIDVNVNEKYFEVNYMESMSQVFKMFRQMQLDLKSETDKELHNELLRTQRMQQDVLHIIELLNFNASEGYNFAKMLQIIGRARRKIKDRIEEREVVKELVKKYEEDFKSILEKTIVDKEKFDRRQDNRSYRIRELTELEGFNDIIKKKKKELKMAS
ncbi:hypothetical protein Kirov_166 [Bacillus phage Kirov]|uniref:Uncharacterized protein n=1 Tax=Bacillus phage Kirov TaxID=2783539 RepID=A0A7U3RX32_9CAUD|nr:hypothetical protein PQE67_gp138 [Bacillus phage Kirov]QOV08365.1 hypothetical protein Kirov_166 [Bacillus phage Kirov]